MLPAEVDPLAPIGTALRASASASQELVFSGLFGDEGSARICPLNDREELKEGGLPPPRRNSAREVWGRKCEFEWQEATRPIRDPITFCTVR